MVMPKTESTKNSKSWIGLLKYIFGLIMQLMGKNKQKEEIQNNQAQMQEQWDKIDEDQKEDFAFIDSMGLDDLKNKINKK
jgi:hypothetical protein